MDNCNVTYLLINFEEHVECKGKDQCEQVENDRKRKAYGNQK